MRLELDGNVTVVTGGASGIGWACAQKFAEEGSVVSIWDIGPAAQEKAELLVSRFGRRSHAAIVDVTKVGDVTAALQETEASLGPVSHLVHAAAIGSGKFGFPFSNLDAHDWARVLEVNIIGMVQVAHALASGMVDRRRGTMVFLGSVAGQIGSQTDPPYSASKAANINFAQCLAKDLAPYGIRVNVVNPGMVQTPLNRRVWQAWNDKQPAESRRSYEDWAGEKVRTVAPLGRWQEPEDIADMVVFLSSARACQVTGQTINVDGGQVMHW